MSICFILFADPIWEIAPWQAIIKFACKTIFSKSINFKFENKEIFELLMFSKTLFNFWEVLIPVVIINLMLSFE